MWKGIIIKLVRILSGEGRGGGWAAAGNNLLRYAEADKEGCAEENQICSLFYELQWK